MNRFSVNFVLTSLFLLLFSSNALAFSVSYDQKVSVDNNPMATIKVVVNDDQMRAESNFGGMTSVLIRNDKGTFSYMPQEKMATKIPVAMDRPNLTRDLPKFMDFLNKNSGKKVGSEAVDGKQTDVYTFMEPTIQKEAKAWVWTEKNFPVKIEVPAPEGLTVVELTNIKFDPSIDPSTFELPSDVKVLDLEAMQDPASLQQGELPGALPTAPPDAPAALEQNQNE